MASGFFFFLSFCFPFSPSLVNPWIELFLYTNYNPSFLPYCFYYNICEILRGCYAIVSTIESCDKRPQKGKKNKNTNIFSATHWVRNSAQVLFADTFHFSRHGEHWQEIRFNQPVFIRVIHIVPRGFVPFPTTLSSFVG